MKGVVLKTITLFIPVLILFLVGPVSGQDEMVLADIENLIDSLETLEAGLFAPKSYEKLRDKYADVKEDIDRKKQTEKIDRNLEDVRVQALNTLEAVQKARLNLEEFLVIRSKAIEAEAPRLAPGLYAEAEKDLADAARKIESNNLNDALKSAQRAGPIYNQAELQAIKTALMGDARTLIAKAVESEAEKYAPTSLFQARSALSRADSILNVERYERDKTLPLIDEAEYEARHAYYITTTIVDIEKTEKNWEQLILEYEEQMNRIAEAVGMKDLKFDSGPGPAADSLVLISSEMEQKIKESLEKLNIEVTADNPAEMAVILEQRVAEMLEEKKELAQTVATKEEELSQLQASHEEVAEDLRRRKEQQARFEKAQSIIGTDEGEVLYSASNDIVIRLPGLSFDIGKSEIKEEHIPLLRKIEEIMRMFPDARFFVEGHTDDRGDPSGNQILSEERARAVMNWLRESMILRPDRISAVGYGSEKPVASNKTAEGRAKNRRIDIIIVR